MLVFYVIEYDYDVIYKKNKNLSNKHKKRAISFFRSKNTRLNEVEAHFQNGNLIFFFRFPQNFFLEKNHMLFFQNDENIFSQKSRNFFFEKMVLQFLKILFSFFLKLETSKFKKNNPVFFKNTKLCKQKNPSKKYFKIVCLLTIKAHLFRFFLSYLYFWLFSSKFLFFCKLATQ